MPTRRDRIITSFGVIEGDWTCDTIGFLGSSKNRAFIPCSLFYAALQATVSIFPLRADAKTASSRAMLLTRWSAVIGYCSVPRTALAKDTRLSLTGSAGGTSAVVIGPPAFADVTIQPSGASTCALSRMSIQPFEPKTAKRDTKGFASEADT